MQISPKLISLRPYIQASILLIVLLLPIIHFYGFVGIRGNFYAWHFLGVPFADPLNAVQLLLQGIVYGFWPAFTVLLGALFSLMVAFMFGRVFCSWLCPYGFLSEVVWKLHTMQAKAKNKLSSWTWRMILVGLALLLGVTLGIPILNQFSAPGLISLAPQEFWQVLLPELGLMHSGVSDMVVPPHVDKIASPLIALMQLMAFILCPVLFVLILEFIFQKRIWCAYICPQSLLLMLAARIGRKSPVPVWQIHWQAEHCTCKGETPCAKACSLGINPRSLHKKNEFDACINCGDCVKNCADINTKDKKALSLALNK